MKMRCHHKRSGQIAGSYRANHFLLVLDEDTPFIEESVTGERRINQACLPVFIHEYWHYWQNVSTVSGFKSFAFTQHVLALFSRVIEPDGTSVGSRDRLTPEEQRKLAELANMQLLHDGEPGPPGCDGDFDIVFRVTRVEKSNPPASYGGRPIPNPTVAVHCQLEREGRSPENVSFVLGSLAIEESVAALIEERLYDGAAAAPSVPMFPYRVVERLAEPNGADASTNRDRRRCNRGRLGIERQADRTGLHTFAARERARALGSALGRQAGSSFLPCAG